MLEIGRRMIVAEDKRTVDMRNVWRVIESRHNVGFDRARNYRRCSRVQEMQSI